MVWMEWRSTQTTNVAQCCGCICGSLMKIADWHGLKIQGSAHLHCKTALWSDSWFMSLTSWLRYKMCKVSVPFRHVNPSFSDLLAYSCPLQVTKCASLVSEMQANSVVHKTDWHASIFITSLQFTSVNTRFCMIGICCGMGEMGFADNSQPCSVLVSVIALYSLLTGCYDHCRCLPPSSASLQVCI